MATQDGGRTLTDRLEGTRYTAPHVRSPTKYYLLDNLRSLGSATYDELAEAVGVEPKKIAAYLSRFRRDRLVDRRETVGTGGAEWHLTDRGRDRLDHWENPSR